MGKILDQKQPTMYDFTHSRSTKLMMRKVLEGILVRLILYFTMAS